jgi:hypothetical protein
MSGRVRRLPTDDSGASLLITVAFVAFVGLVTGALLTYGGTSVTGAKSTKYRADVVYDVDGALQAGINQIRNSTYINAPAASACPPLNFPAANLGPGKTIAVTCAGGPGTGLDGGLVKINDLNKPGQALLTLGDGANANERNGIDSVGNELLRIKGGVFSNSGVRTSPSDISISGAQLLARGACTGTIISTPAKICNYTASDPLGVDPDYAAPTDDLVYRTVPTSCAGGSTIRFKPGYYDDAKALTDLTTSPGCVGKTLLFEPGPDGTRGVYYFDFHNGESPGLPAASHVWTINRDLQLVAGEPKGWDPDASPQQVPTIPGSCVSPLDGEANGGVAWVFGGDSRMNITSGQVEICGHYFSDKPPVAIYGAKTGTDVVNGPEDEKSDGTGDNSGALDFSTPGNLKETDGSASVATLGVGGKKTAVVTLQGFSPTTAVPKGSLLTAAKLVVVHKDVPRSSGGTLSSLTAVVTPNASGAGTALAAVNVPTHEATPGSWSTDQVALDLDDLAKQVHRDGLAGAKIVFSAAVTGSALVDETVDSIQLRLTWKPPAVRAESGCVTAVPASSNCYLLSTSGPDTRTYFQGTTYAPKAALDIFMNNASGQVFRSGLIVRSLKVKVNPSTTYTGPIIEIPDNSLGPRPTDVYFKAYVCPEGSTCSAPAPAAPWRLGGSARASFEDADPVHPATGTRKVKVYSWTTYR